MFLRNKLRGIIERKRFVQNPETNDNVPRVYNQFKLSNVVYGTGSKISFRWWISQNTFLKPRFDIQPSSVFQNTPWFGVKSQTRFDGVSSLYTHHRTATNHTQLSSEAKLSCQIPSYWVGGLGNKLKKALKTPKQTKHKLTNNKNNNNNNNYNYDTL